MTDVVTGAYSYTGRHIAARLLAAGRDVRTLSRRPRGPGDLEIPSSPLQFEDVPALTAALVGVETLYNTYWIRFPHEGATFEQAVARSGTLFRAARDAGVGRIVHISVTNAAADSPYPYFRGKAAVERVLAEVGVPYAIVRPTLIFGPQDILVNNIAWILRRFPVFLLPGGGSYEVQPVWVDDVAELAVTAATAPSNPVLDAVGPDTITFGELVRAVREAVGGRAHVVGAPPWAALALTRIAGTLLRDVVLTRDELGGLMDGLLVTDGVPTGGMRFVSWLTENADVLGNRYVSELARNWRLP